MVAAVGTMPDLEPKPPTQWVLLGLLAAFSFGLCCGLGVLHYFEPKHTIEDFAPKGRDNG